MELVLKRQIKKILITSLLLACNKPEAGINPNLGKPIHIDSEKQIMDIENNMAIASGNVTITQGNLKIKADKTTISFSGAQNQNIIINAYGQLIKFYQILDNGQSITGHAEKINYDIDKEQVQLSGNAYLEQTGNSIQGNCITYLINKKEMHAISYTGQHVTTIFTPSHRKDHLILKEDIKKDND
ncbi:lipopolysaccharide transport periplasmic protein LptA [Candidatus Erwinia haradaeae]|uniref:Lipopolysaccharide export system protein LptA n=1 Tax=Candidatus Erwinia haradaeae TaxID=1922217 RepID=A0A803GCZ8_9GAMM|nr:lipopolysaccharide transport periplasmic protein LptA [Candidatus Erwinia haradaeae]VFP88853.1 Lipopolysaccharide export system protein LptA [Candidatus Erwinia haradaeae]